MPKSGSQEGLLSLSVIYLINGIFQQTGVLAQDDEHREDSLKWTHWVTMPEICMHRRQMEDIWTVNYMESSWQLLFIKKDCNGEESPHRGWDFWLRGNSFTATCSKNKRSQRKNERERKKERKGGGKNFQYFKSRFGLKGFHFDSLVTLFFFFLMLSYTSR